MKLCGKFKEWRQQMHRQIDIFGVIALGILASLRLYFLWKAAAIFKTMNMEILFLMIVTGWWFFASIAFLWIYFETPDMENK